ncbi:hypothetical protein [Myroides fluvii]|uniref:hypothetical protein n=1 Tax=Myroides fluvii TaxID=2572594 RepID=UPI00131A8CF1|nr:hypothetical protein [Myroides fluvii]
MHIRLKGKQVVTMTCDCGELEEGLCIHKFCMLEEMHQQLNGASKGTQTPTLKKQRSSTKKLTPSAALLHETGQEQVYAWFLELFKKNKEVEQEFLLTFQEKEQKIYTVQNLETIFDDVHKAVFGKRKSADAKDIKKYVDLLALALKPVQDFMLVSIGQSSVFDLYHYSMKRMYFLGNRVNYTSKRIETFIVKLVDFYSLALVNIKDHTTQENIVKQLFIKLYDQSDFHLETITLELLAKIYTQNSNPSIKQVFSIEITKLLEYNKNKKRKVEVEQLYFFLAISIETDTFKDHYRLFEPIRYENKYNLLLLEHLVDYDRDLTAKYCKEIIASNYNPYYNVPYINLLDELYRVNENYQGLAQLKADHFLLDPTIEDYLFIVEHLDDEMLVSRFRIKVLSSLRNSFSCYAESTDYADLYFKILYYEQNYKKMLEVLDRNVPQSIIYLYAEEIHKFNAKNFLNAVLNLGQYAGYNYIAEPKLAAFIVNHYTKEEIHQVFKKYKSQKQSLNELILNSLKAD